MGTGKKKIEIKKIEKESRRLVTFTKRRNGLFKKAHQLQTLTGCHIALIVFSPAGKPFIYGEPSFDPIIDRYLNTTTIHARINYIPVHDDQYVNSGSPSSGNSTSHASNNNGPELDLETLMLGIEKDDVEGCGELELMRMKKDLEEKREKVGERLATMENEFLDCLLQFAVRLRLGHAITK